ncbi:MAG: beta-galactosidase [Chloroflexi bacterium]|nr:beta-galactosidase [Chloroflexota bacterium]MCL5274186.1 beta-galactosidase [Chloroflexota bacterium]
MTRHAFLYTIVLSLLLLGCAAVIPGPLSVPPLPYPRERVASPGYGMEAYLWWKPEIATRDLGLIRSAGFSWVKQTFAWRDIELEKGKYDWSHADTVVSLTNHFGLKLLIRLDRDPYWDRSYKDAAGIATGPPKDLRNFTDFCGVIAARYRGKVAGYQVWNEPNLAREWGGQPPNPAEYVQMLRGCYLAIKSVDPQALVISAGLAPTGNELPEAMPDTEFLEAMYQAGAQPYFDLLGVHAPGFKAAPETSPEKAAQTPSLGGQRFFAFRGVEDMRAIMVKHGDADKQVAILEFGWTTDPVHKDYAWFAVDEKTKADYMVRAYEWAKTHWQPWIGPMIALSLPEFDWTPDNEQYWWALIDPVYPQTVTRPAYDALKNMPK